MLINFRFELNLNYITESKFSSIELIFLGRPIAEFKNLNRLLSVIKLWVLMLLKFWA